MKIITRPAVPRATTRRDSGQFKGPRKAGPRLLDGFLVAALAGILIPVSGLSQGSGPGEDLQQEWLEMQEHGSRQARKAFWQDLDVGRLNSYLENGANVDVADKRGWTPLHSAARYNSNPEVLAALIEAGAAADARNRSGDTPLHWAAAENTSVQIIKTLLGAGADVNARDKYGWLPIHTAAEGNSNPKVIETLLAAGAKRNKRAYFLLFRPVFLLKHNSNMSEKDKETAIALLKAPE